MSKEDKLYKIWVYLQAEPLFWITLTLGAFLLGDYLYKKSKLNPLVNPVAISILIVSSVLLTMDVTYDRYFNGAKFIHFMLGPATVALAKPGPISIAIASTVKASLNFLLELSGRVISGIISGDPY